MVEWLFAYVFCAALLGGNLITRKSSPLQHSVVSAEHTVGHVHLMPPGSNPGCTARRFPLIFFILVRDVMEYVNGAPCPHLHDPAHANCDIHVLDVFCIVDVADVGQLLASVLG